jgi:hypothetical protein
VCDVFVPQGDGKFIYYPFLTKDLATGFLFKDLDHYYTVVLSFGETRSN